MMFSRIGTLLGASGVAQAFERFMRKLQTDVEHTRVTNSTLAAFTPGTVLAFVVGAVDRHAELAYAAAGENDQWVAIASEPIAAGIQGVAQTNGRTPVRFAAGLTPVDGTLCYVSDLTAGVATNVPTVVVGASVTPIGRIVDTSRYADEHICDVILGLCCEPAAVIG